MKRNSKIRLAVALAAFVLAALVGVPAATAATAEAGTSGAKLRKITFLIGTSDINVAYPFATLPTPLGWYRQEGLEVEVLPAQSSTNVAQLLLAGKADVGMIVPESGVVARAAQGLPLKSIYEVARKNSYTFAVLADSGIRSVRDLKGKKVGHVHLGAGTVPYAATRYRDAGFTERDVQSIGVGYGPPAMEAMKRGTVDAIVGFTAMWALLKSAGYDFRLLSEAGWQSKMPGWNLYATDAWIKKNPRTIEKIGRAMSKAILFARTNPAATVRIFWKQYPDKAPADPSDRKALARDYNQLMGNLKDMKVFGLGPKFPWGWQSLGKWRFLQDYMYGTGQIPRKVNPRDLYYAGAQAKYNTFNKQAIIRKAKNWPNR